MTKNQYDGLLVALEGLIIRPAGDAGPQPGLDIIIRMAADRRGCGESDIRKKMTVIKEEEPASLDYSDYMAAFELDYSEFWSQLNEYHAHNTEILEDGVEMAKHLAGAGYKLYAFSKGTIMDTFALLTRAGLGTPGGSEFFTNAFGVHSAADLGCMDETMWRIVFAYSGVRSNRLGFLAAKDYYEPDVPLKSGVNTCLIIDRTQTEPSRTENKTIFFNSTNARRLIR